MQRIKRIGLAGVAMLLVAVVLTAAVPVFANTAEAPTISVSGAGAIAVAPDMATVNLGVSTDADTAALALSRNNAEVEAVLKAIRAFGIKDEDIRTQWFNIHQRMDWGEWTGTPRVAGYTVSNTVVVTVRDLDIVGEIIGAGVAAGANISAGVQFGISDSSELYLEALALAAKDAQRKADVLARALGRTVSGLINITESGVFHAPMAREFMAMDMAISATAAAGMNVPLQAGELVVTARVQVTYGIR